MTDSGLAAFLAHLVKALEAVNATYMVVGSLASSVHGEPRATRDVDVVVVLSRRQVVELGKYFPEEDFYFDEDMAREAAMRGSQFNIIDTQSMWKADLIVARDAFTHEELRRRVKITLGTVPMYVASPEDTIISKMSWARDSASGRQLDDAAGVVRVAGPSLDLAYIESWVARLGLEEQWQEVVTRASGG